MSDSWSGYCYKDVYPVFDDSPYRPTVFLDQIKLKKLVRNDTTLGIHSSSLHLDIENATNLYVEGTKTFFITKDKSLLFPGTHWSLKVCYYEHDREEVVIEREDQSCVYSLEDHSWCRKEAKDKTKTS